ncbi:MAG: sensor histidine kinase [Chitinophagaceae bacterium]
MKYLGIIIALFLTATTPPYAQVNVAADESVTTIQADSLTLVKQLEQGKLLFKTDSAKATRILLAVRANASKSNLALIEAEACIYLGHIYYANQIYHRAFGSYLTARKIYEANPDKGDVTELILAIARTQYHRGNYRLAVSNFVDGLQLARKQNQKAFEAEALENLGLLYNSFQGFNEGTGYYFKALKINQSLNDTSGVVRLAGILAETYYRKRLFDSSNLFSKIAYIGAQKLGLTTEAYMADINTAMSLIRLKDWKAAEEVLLRLGKSVYNNQDDNRRFRYEIAYGNFYLSQGDIPKGNIWFDKARQTLKDNYYPERLALIYRNKAESYFERNDYRQAYENLLQYNNYISQMYSGKNIANLGSMENIMSATTSKDEVKLLGLQNELKQNQLFKELLIRHGLERENSLIDSGLSKEKRLTEALQRENTFRQNELEKETSLKAALNRENILAASQLKKERSIKFLLLAGGLLLLVSAGATFYFYNKQRKKNAVIQKQADDVQVLMKEIHHRVKNNLQIISSLLDLQSMTMKDSHAAEAVKEGKNRVQSMALIHQNLYSEGNIKAIKAKEYINNLLESLCNSYNIGKDKVEINTEIDDLSLDVDTMIPLGLVLNELVSNSLKYAFKNQQKGELHLVLELRPQHLLLKVSDNGSGFPEGLDIKSNKSFGLKMIRAFAQKLKANLDIYNNNGAVVEMHITKYKLA